MPTNVIMPALGPDQETGILVSWLKHEGETVTRGEPLMEVETDKALVEIEAPVSGTLAAVAASEGAEIPVGQVIAVILGEGERGGVGVRGASPATQPDRPLASPRARREAAERGIDLTRIKGSGPAGALTAADVAAASQSSVSRGGPPAGGRPRASATPMAPAPSWQASRAWRTMAERMARSWTTVPQFSLSREVLAGGLVEARSRLASADNGGASQQPTYTDLLVKLVATALHRDPRMNASWVEDNVRENVAVNVAIAVATDEALYAPVIQAADTLTVGEIAVRRAGLVERANAGKLTLEDLAGGTFTLTNLGMFGVDAFTAIVNPPQAAILAVGRIADGVVAIDGQPSVRPTMVLTLTCDHRVVDGARAARFLDNLASLIEEPARSLG